MKDWCPHHRRPVDGSLNRYWKAVCYRCGCILEERPKDWEKLTRESLKRESEKS